LEVEGGGAHLRVGTQAERVLRKQYEIGRLAGGLVDERDRGRDVCGHVTPRCPLHERDPERHRTALTAPPSTASVLPAMKLERADAKNATASATSSGCAQRPSGISRTTFAVSSSGVVPLAAALAATICCIRSVAVAPGCTWFTRTPAGASSRDICFARA